MVEYSHARSISVEIEKLISNVMSSYKELDAVAINQGPGSFTGLRVGSSVAKGLCYGLDIPLISIDGLEVYGHYFFQKFSRQFSDIYILLDARKDNFFYSHISNGQTITSVAFSHISEIENIISHSPNPWIFYSNRDNIENLKSEYLLQASLDKWKEKIFVDIANFEPLYLIDNYTKK